MKRRLLNLLAWTACIAGYWSLVGGMSVKTSAAYLCAACATGFWLQAWRGHF